MEKHNELSLVKTREEAERYLGRHAVMNRTAGGHDERVVALRHVGKLILFRPGLNHKWTLEIKPGDQRSGQVDHPKDDHYIYLTPFVNCLAPVGTPLEGKRFIGTEVLMWDNGWSPVRAASRKLRIISFSPHGTANGDNVTCSWRGKSVSDGGEWCGQSTHIRSSYYIIPVSAFDPKEARTPAESLARIFLGG